MHRKASFAVSLVALSAGVVFAGDIDFYEGEKGTQTKHCTLNDKAGQQYNLKDNGAPCVNDDVVSVVLRNVRAHCKITMTDDPGGNKNKDDYVIIVVKKPKSEYTVNHLEQSYEDEYVKVSYGKDNGLNGKVSNIKIE